MLPRPRPGSKEVGDYDMETVARHMQDQIDELAEALKSQKKFGETLRMNVAMLSGRVRSLEQTAVSYQQMFFEFQAGKDKVPGNDGGDES